MQRGHFGVAAAVVVPVLFLLAGVAGAQDSNEKLIKYYRKKANIPPATAVSVKESKDSPISGVKQGKMTVGTQEVGFISSADGRYVVFGELEDVTVDPSKAIMAKIQLEGEAFKGPKDAPITIVEYSDFQCPFCARGYNTIEQEVLTAYPGKIKFYYKHLPLPFHNWAEPGSIAMECVKKQSPEAGWKVYEKFFADQKSITAENVKDKALEYAGSGVDKAKYTECYDKKETLDTVRAHKAEAASLGISGTPSFVVNGRLVKGAQPAQSFKAVIDDELASAK